MDDKIRNRRRFLGRMTGVAAALGAALSGLVPELGVAAGTSGTSPPPTDPTTPPLPTLTPLSDTDLARQYSAALNNPDVTLLVSTLGEPGRIDPPSASGAGGFGSGSTIQSIVLPIVSYASGATLAYVYYGDTNVVADDGAHYYQFRAMVTAAGEVSLAGGGQLAPTPKPEWNDVLFATLFPDQYLAARVQVSLADAPTRQYAGGGSTGWNPFNLRKLAGGLWNPLNLRKTNAVDSKGYAACVHGCTQTYNTCWTTGTNWGIAGTIMAIACIACIAINIATLPTGAGAAAVAKACLVVCAIATSAIIQAISTLVQCSNNYKSCVASCKDVYLKA